jgi:hypothetical protein
LIADARLGTSVVVEHNSSAGRSARRPLPLRWLLNGRQWSNHRSLPPALCFRRALFIGRALVHRYLVKGAPLRFHAHLGVPPAGSTGFVDGPGIRLIDCHGAERDYQLEKRIISNFTGIAAEAKYVGRLRWANAADDFDAAVELALRRSNCKTTNELEYYLRYTWACANEYFAFPSRWPKVAAVAEALLKKRRLSFEEVANIIEEHHEPFQASQKADAFLRFLIRRSLRWRPWRPRRVKTAVNANPLSWRGARPRRQRACPPPKLRNCRRRSSHHCAVMLTPSASSDTLRSAP